MRPTAILIACALAGVAPAAANAAPDNDCPADAFGCVYGEPDGGGDRYVIRECRNGFMELPSGWWDRADSVRVVKAGLINLYSYNPKISGGTELVLWATWATRGRNVNTYKGQENKADLMLCKQEGSDS